MPAGGTCQSEFQQRECQHGSWGAWDGTYAYDSCYVELTDWGHCLITGEYCQRVSSNQTDPLTGCVGDDRTRGSGACPTSGQVSRCLQSAPTVIIQTLVAYNQAQSDGLESACVPSSGLEVTFTKY